VVTEQIRRRIKLEGCISTGTGIEYDFNWFEYPATDTIKLEIVHPTSFRDSDFTVRFKFKDGEVPSLLIDITDNRRNSGNPIKSSTVCLTGYEIYQPATIYGVLSSILHKKVW
jgi:hypothetical protein